MCIRDRNGEYDFECLEAVDVELFNRQLKELLAGKEVVIPRFNFVTGHKEYGSDVKKLGENDVLVIEGIHCLNPKLTESLPDENKFKIYISALTQLNIDEHNRIPTTDGRLIRRIVRDARTRGSSAKRTISMWPSVRRGEERNIFPYQEEADVMFNSALIYELAVLKPYVAVSYTHLVAKGEEEKAINMVTNLYEYYWKHIRLLPDPVSYTHLREGMPMLEKLDLTKTLSKSEYKEKIMELEPKIGKLQRECKDLGIPVMIAFEGYDAAGKGVQIGELIKALDPRGFEVHAVKKETEEEQMHPFLWRFWTKMPSKGRIAIYDSSWYRKVLIDRFDKKTKKKEVADVYKRQPYDLRKIASLVKTRIEIFPDIREQIDFFEELPEYDTTMYCHKKMKTNEENSLEVLKDVLDILKGQDDFSNDGLFAALKGYVDEKGYKTGFVMWPVRTAVSGKQNTPGGATEIMEILGKEESLAPVSYTHLI